MPRGYRSRSWIIEIDQQLRLTAYTATASRGRRGLVTEDRPPKALNAEPLFLYPLSTKLRTSFRFDVLLSSNSRGRNNKRVKLDSRPSLWRMPKSWLSCMRVLGIG